MSGSFSSPFGTLVHTFRIRAGLSQEALSEASGISVRTISDLERGQRASAHLETIRLLADALGLTTDQHRQLIESAHSAPRAVPDAPQPVERARTRSAPWAAPLPAPVTALVGRTHELATLLTALAPGSGGIVTLIGTGGVGKTRLSLEAGYRLAPAYADGAVFVDLVPVTQAERVPEAIAQALGLAPRSSAIREQLIDILSDREVLLILDNFEHVVDAAPFLARLDEGCPRLTMLVTSRVRLRLSNEIPLPLDPMTLPELSDAPEQLLTNEANLLFAERASRSDPGFILSERTVVTVTEICRKLDGIPLAIELAASRLRVLPVADLRDRLDRPLAILTGGSRDLHPRQQSMRNAIVWSYSLLDQKEKQFLRWMAVFVGGLSLESAEALGAKLDANVDESLELVTTLLESGLIRRTEAPGEPPRYSAFESIREFGFERLEITGELEAARRFHADHFLAYARRDHAPPYMQGRKPQTDRLAAERHNLIQAFDALCQPETAEECLCIATPMAQLWRLRGPYSEGQPRILRAVDLAPKTPSVEKVHLLNWATHLLGVLPDRAIGYHLARMGIETAEAIDSPIDLAASQQAMAFIYEYNQQFDQARPLYEHLIPIWESYGNEIMLGLCLMLLGGIEYASGNIERAQPMEERAADLFLSIDNHRNAAAAMFYQGMFAVAQGRLDVAAEKYDRSLRLWLLGDSDQAWFKAFVGLADVAAALGLYESAARFLGAAEQLLRLLGAELMLFDKPGYARARAACLNALDPDRFALLVSAGRQMPDEALLIESREIVDAARVYSPSER